MTTTPFLQVRLSLLNPPTVAGLEDAGSCAPRGLEWSGDGQLEWSSLIVRETAYGFDDEDYIAGST